VVLKLFLVFRWDRRRWMPRRAHRPRRFGTPFFQARQARSNPRRVPFRGLRRLLQLTRARQLTRTLNVSVRAQLVEARLWIEHETGRRAFAPTRNLNANSSGLPPSPTLAKARGFRAPRWLPKGTRSEPRGDLGSQQISVDGPTAFRLL